MLNRERSFGSENVLDEIKQVSLRRDSNPKDIISFQEMKRKPDRSMQSENSLRRTRQREQAGRVSWSWLRPDEVREEYSSEFVQLLEQLFFHRSADHKRQPYFDPTYGAALVDVHNMIHTNLETGETYPIERKVILPSFLERMFSRNTLDRTLSDDMSFYLFGKNKQHEGIGREKEYIAGPDPFSSCDNRVEFISQCGGKRLNQDNLCVCSTIDGLLCVGVFDGHGPEGHLVSQVAAELALQEIRKLTERDELNVEVLHEMFAGIDRGICEHTMVSSLLSGTTVSFAMKDGDQYWFSHVGDSSIVLIREEKGEWIAEKISKDHRPSDISEKERIEKNGGVVRNFSGTARVFLEDWTTAEKIIAEKVRSENETYLLAERRDLLPGLSLSRSLGDELGKIAGISAEPEVFTCQLQPPYLGALLASDGLWDAFDTPQDAIATLQTYMKVENMSRRDALRRIAKLSRNYYISRNKKGLFHPTLHQKDVVESIDDITIAWLALESSGVITS